MLTSKTFRNCIVYGAVHLSFLQPQHFSVQVFYLSTHKFIHFVPIILSKQFVHILASVTYVTRCTNFGMLELSTYLSIRFCILLMLIL